MSDPPEIPRPRYAWALFQGGALLMLGALALLVPRALPWAVGSEWHEMMGVVLLSSGAVGLIAGLSLHPAEGLRWQMLWALLTALAGSLLLTPLSHAPLSPLGHSLVLLSFVLATGILSLCHALGSRTRGWGWMLCAGLGELSLGGLMSWSLLSGERPEVIQVLPAAALSWHGLLLVILGRARRKWPLAQELPSPKGCVP